MIEEALFLLLGLILAFNIGLLYALRRCEALLHGLELTAGTMDPTSAVDAMRQEVGDLVAEVVGSMRPPTIADHLGGVMAQFAQMRMMKMMQAEGMLPDAVSQAMDDSSPLD